MRFGICPASFQYEDNTIVSQISAVIHSSVTDNRSLGRYRPHKKWLQHEFERDIAADKAVAELTSVIWSSATVHETVIEVKRDGIAAFVWKRSRTNRKHTQLHWPSVYPYLVANNQWTKWYAPTEIHVSSKYEKKEPSLSLHISTNWHFYFLGNAPARPVVRPCTRKMDEIRTRSGRASYKK